ncbi:hypothetical protein EON65_23045 [archaeon]|nr:MAG: hypothetical protein EON65_23045 [archaeon]
MPHPNIYITPLPLIQLFRTIISHKHLIHPYLHLLGALAGYPLFGVRIILTDGAAHPVDSNDMAFQLAMVYGIRQVLTRTHIVSISTR